MYDFNMHIFDLFWDMQSNILKFMKDIRELWQKIIDFQRKEYLFPDDGKVYAFF